MLVRLRFPAILVISFLVIGKWDVLHNYWSTLTRAALKDDPAYGAISNDTEYFCPMDPGVVSAWPSKCGICNMGLVRRKRGDGIALPDGIIARMQLSPYRVQLAGIQTAPVTYHALSLEARSSAVAELSGTPDEKDPVVLARFRFPTRSAALAGRGQHVMITCDDLPNDPAVRGTVRELTPEIVPGDTEALVEIANPDGAIRPGMILSAELSRPVAELEPFRSLPSGVPPLKRRELRELYLCPEHPDQVSEEPGDCPIGKNPLDYRPLSEFQRVRYWCPMHAEVTADHAGEKCEACGGMVLRPRIITFRPPGQVLGIPESAIVDTGTRKIVFVERMPGMFDGIEVTVGKRCGDYYPVISGLEPDDHVATAGSFLLDAETRLNPSLAASYFGAGSRTASASTPATRQAERDPASAETSAMKDPFALLSPADRILARKQATCPVTKKPLESMGGPVRIMLDGKPVFLCCEGCESSLRDQPEKYLGKPRAQSASDRANPSATSAP